MHYSDNNIRRIVEKPEVIFEQVEVSGVNRTGLPEERVVIREEGEDEAEEESSCWRGRG